MTTTNKRPPEVTDGWDRPIPRDANPSEMAEARRVLLLIGNAEVSPAFPADARRVLGNEWQRLNVLLTSRHTPYADNLSTAVAEARRVARMWGVEC